MIKFSHMIFYVQNIKLALSFYKEAFDIETKFIHESEEYAELSTGETTLAFASEALGNSNLPNEFIPNNNSQLPASNEITLTAKDVKKAYNLALSKGAIDVIPPKEKPWGQLVAYIRDPNGLLIEIASSM
jgi:lactoylglutathione lyase